MPRYTTPRAGRMQGDSSRPRRSGHGRHDHSGSGSCRRAVSSEIPQGPAAFGLVPRRLCLEARPRGDVLRRCTGLLTRFLLRIGRGAGPWREADHCRQERSPGTEVSGLVSCCHCRFSSVEISCLCSRKHPILLKGSATSTSSCYTLRRYSREWYLVQITRMAGRMWE